ncbi:MAG: hypothetical protein ACYTDX_00180 [Planctomycetota bacterium]|jgi:hypothetical protein
MNPGEAALRFVLHVHARLRNIALMEAVAGPAAFVLLALAGVLALARTGNLAGVPDRFLVIAFAMAFFVALARLIKTLPRIPDAARHLDRELEARERWITVLEAATSDLPVAEWAARGAMDGLRGRTVSDVVPYRPPAAAVPLLLAVVLVSGLALLPTQTSAAGDDREAAVVIEAGSSAAGARRPGEPRPSSSSRDPRVLMASEAVRAGAESPKALQVIDDLKEAAREAGDEAALEKIRAAEESLEAGDAAGAASLIGEAAESLHGLSKSGAGASVEGASGDGEAAGSAGTGTASHGPRRFPVAPRYREAVRRYFEALGSDDR